MTDAFSADIAAISRIDAVPKILEVVCRITGMGFAAVARVTDERWIACAVRDQIQFGLEPGGELEVETTLCSEIRDSAKPVVIDDVETDEVYSGHPTPAMYGFKSYISIPVFRADGSFFGTLCAIDPRPAKLNTPETLGMFTLFAELIALHLDAQERLASSEAALLDARNTAKLREEFIAVLGHDLRNPLGSIVSGIEVLNSTATGERLDERVRRRAGARARADRGRHVRALGSECRCADSAGEYRASVPAVHARNRGSEPGGAGSRALRLEEAGFVYGGRCRTRHKHCSRRGMDMLLLPRAWRGYRQSDFPQASWAIEDEVLHARADAARVNLVSQRQYGDFDLSFEWRLTVGGNSGVLYRVSEDCDEAWQSGPEMQLLDNANHPDGSVPETACGALYGLVAPVNAPQSPPGIYNIARIRVQGSQVEHWLNGVRVLACDIASGDFRARVAQSKFRDGARFAAVSSGHIVLQHHGSEAWFRNMRIEA